MTYVLIEINTIAFENGRIHKSDKTGKSFIGYLLLLLLFNFSKPNIHI